MLTGNLVRTRIKNGVVTPVYLDVRDAEWRAVAERLLELFRTLAGKTRGELEEEVALAIGDHPSQLVHQGLAKLLEDRCEFEIDSALKPEELREKVFLAAAAKRKVHDYDREAILGQVAIEVGVAAAEVDRGLFADLKSEQRLVSFKDFSSEQLLHRYNEALAQAVLLRSTSVTVRVVGEHAARYRRLFRAIKFHRLICEIQHIGNDGCTFRLDGPLSLFSSTQKYGIQLANFLPSLLPCKKFELTAVVRWGAERKERSFTLSEKAGLRSHTVDYGDHTAKELEMFAASFAKSVAGWTLSAEPDVVPLPTGFWVPDFSMVHEASGSVVRVELLGYWKRTDAAKLYERLRGAGIGPFVLAASDAMNADESGEDMDERIYRYKRTPLPAEVVRRAEAQLR